MRTVLIMVLVVGVTGAAPGSASDRLTDPQVKRIVENIDHAFNEWRGYLDRRDLDEAVVRAAEGTFDAERFLDDMEKDIDLVRERLGDRYAAGAEVTALLRRASDLERGSVALGRPERWKLLSGEFASLARAYRVAWPMDAAATAQRITDHELADHAKRIAGAVDRLQDGALEAAEDMRLGRSERRAAEQAMDELETAAERLGDDLDSHRFVAHHVRRVLDLTVETSAFAATVRPMSMGATEALTTVEQSARVIALAFDAR
jgi:hypothetical protein